jgi:hypothetical protein
MSDLIYRVRAPLTTPAALAIPTRRWSLQPGNGASPPGAHIACISGPTAASRPGAITIMDNWAMGQPPTAPRLPRVSPWSPPSLLGTNTPSPSRPTAASGPGGIIIMGNWATGLTGRNVPRLPRSSRGLPPSLRGVITASPSRSTAASGPGAITDSGNWVMGRPPVVHRPSRFSPGLPASPPGAITP